MTRLREGRPVDRAALETIQTLTLAEPSPDLLSAAFDPGPPTLTVAIEEAEPDQPVGYALAIPGTTTYLAELAVAPAWQGEGIGSALLERICAGADRVRVTTRAGDDRARAFYEARGFERVERLPGFFASEDGVALVR